MPLALTGAPWSEDGLAAVAEGRCGAALKADYRRLLDLRAVDREIAGFDDLRAATGGVWAGFKTRLGTAEVALSFHRAVRPCPSIGP